MIAAIAWSGSVCSQIDMGFSIWDVSGEGRCGETLTFMGDKEYLLESGEQLITKAYKFKQYRKTDFYIFSQRTIANNGQPNCSGIEGSRKGTRLKIYVKFNAEVSQMTFYEEPDDEKAMGVVFEKRQ